MCHDGAGQSKLQRRSFRAMIHWFMKKGYNTALINSLQFLDTKVMAIVSEFLKRTVEGPDIIQVNASEPSVSEGLFTLPSERLFAV